MINNLVGWAEDDNGRICLKFIAGQKNLLIRLSTAPGENVINRHIKGEAIVVQKITTKNLAAAMSWLNEETK